MNHDDPIKNAAKADPPQGRKSLIVAMIMTALIAAFFLLREYWLHMGGYWPYLLLLAFPLVHLFHGYRGHGSEGTGSATK